MDARLDGLRAEDETAPEPGTDDRLRHALTELGSVARSFDLAGHMERHPYALVAAAGGVGFVLGGGLFQPLAGRLVRTGLRLALLPLAEQLIVRLLSPERGEGTT